MGSTWSDNGTVSNTAAAMAEDEDGESKWDMIAFAPSPSPAFHFLLAAGRNCTLRAAVADAAGLKSTPFLYPVTIPTLPAGPGDARVLLGALRQSGRLGDLSAVAQLTVATVLTAVSGVEDSDGEQCGPSDIVGSALSAMAMAIASQPSLSPSRRLEAATAASAAAAAATLPSSTITASGLLCACIGSIERGLLVALVALATSNVVPARNTSSGWSTATPTSGAATVEAVELAHRELLAVGSTINALAVRHVLSSTELTGVPLCSANTTENATTGSPDVSVISSQLFFDFLSVLEITTDAKFTSAVEASAAGDGAWWQGGSLIAVGPGAANVGSGAWGLCARVLPHDTCGHACSPPLDGGGRNDASNGACGMGGWATLDEAAAAAAAAEEEGDYILEMGTRKHSASAMPLGKVPSLGLPDLPGTTASLEDEGGRDRAAGASAKNLVAWTQQSVTIPSTAAAAEMLVSKVAVRRVVLMRTTTADITDQGPCADGGPAVWRRVAEIGGNSSMVLVPVVSSGGRLAPGVKEGAKCVMWQSGSWTPCCSRDTSSSDDGCVYNSSGGSDDESCCSTGPPKMECFGGECVAECACQVALKQGLFVAVKFDPCAAVCGNGRLDLGEECDDGEDIAGDGCDSVCQIEPGFACNQSAPAVTTSSGEAGGEEARQCTNGRDGASLCVLAAVDMLAVTDSTDLPSAQNRIFALFAVRLSFHPKVPSLQSDALPPSPSLPPSSLPLSLPLSSSPSLSSCLSSPTLPSLQYE